MSSDMKERHQSRRETSLVALPFPSHLDTLQRLMESIQEKMNKINFITLCKDEELL